MNLKHFFTAVAPFHPVSTNTSSLGCGKQPTNRHTHTHTLAPSPQKSHYHGYQPAFAERQGMLFLSPPSPPLLQPVLLINEEVLGPQLLIRTYRLSVCQANQSRPSDSWAMKNVAWWMEGRLGTGRWGVGAEWLYWWWWWGHAGEEGGEGALYLIRVRSQLYDCTLYT